MRAGVKIPSVAYGIPGKVIATLGPEQGQLHKLSEGDSSSLPNAFDGSLLQRSSHLYAANRFNKTGGHSGPLLINLPG